MGSSKHGGVSMCSQHVLLALGVFGGCATQSREALKLPFHVALMPPVALPEASATKPEGNATDFALAFDANRMMAQLEASLGRTFSRVTRLSAPGEGGADPGESKWVVKAKQQGADLILRPTLRYDPKVNTSLNDRFWLNLPLFAIGGPFGWFVPDRSYYCYSRLDAELFDVSVAAGGTRSNLDAVSRVLRVERETTEASLNFLDRASGLGPFLLSFVCPAGLIATESAAVPAELDAAVTAQLCQALTRAMQDRATEITESDLVDFYPRAVRIMGTGPRFLAGEIVLQLGEANELGRSLRYRVGSRRQTEVEWGKISVLPPNGRTRGRKVYPFQIPLDGGITGTVQIEVEQLDRSLSRRTFTYLLESLPVQ